MKRAIFALWVVLAASFMAPLAEAGKAVTSTFLLPGNGAIRLATPDSWSGHMEHSSDSPFLTIHFSPLVGAPFTVMLTPMWFPKGKRLPGLEAVRSMVESTAREAEGNAVEKHIELKEFGSNDAHGFYFTATDRAPKPDEYKYMTQGMAQLGELLLTFTILTNDGQAAVIHSALTMIGGVEHDRNIVSLLSKSGDIYRIAVPLSDRFIQFPVSDYHVEMEDNSRPYYMLTSRNGVSVSFNFERVHKCNSSEACRDYLRDRMKSGDPAKEQWSSSQLGDVFISEYTIPSLKGIPIRQHNLNAHYIVDDVWIDMHLSKTQYSDSDRKLFADFVRSVAVTR